MTFSKKKLREKTPLKNLFLWWCTHNSFLLDNMCGMVLNLFPKKQPTLQTSRELEQDMRLLFFHAHGEALALSIDAGLIQ